MDSWVIGVALALLAALLMVVLSKASHTERRMEDLETRTLEALSGMQAQLNNSLARQQEELHNSSRQTQDSIVNTVSAISGNQTLQLNEVLRTLREDHQLEEMRLDRLCRNLEGRIAEMRQVVDEKLDAKLDTSLAQMGQKLERIYKEVGELQSLSGGVNDLKNVLTNVKTRGIWGEMQLGNILAEILTPEQYITNAQTKPGSQERVEFALCLPGREEENGRSVLLPIDSKFPQEDYLRLVSASSAGDAEAVKAARKGLETRIKGEAKDIRDKYIAVPYTTDFGILFLPTEGLYAEAAQLPGLLETLQNEYRVVVAGPSTLAGLLNSLQMGFRTLAVEQRSQEIWNLLGNIKADFDTFTEILLKTQDRLRQASDTIDTAFSRTRTIQRKLKAVQNLDNLPESGKEEQTLP